MLSRDVLNKSGERASMFFLEVGVGGGGGALGKILGKISGP